MGVRPADPDGLLTPAQVAAILYVDPRTVTRWAIAGTITAIRTLGGHRRHLRSEIARLRHGTAGESIGPTPANSRARPAPGDVGPVAGAVVDAADLTAFAAGAARQERALATRLRDRTDALVVEVAAAALEAAAAHAAPDVARGTGPQTVSVPLAGLAD